MWDKQKYNVFQLLVSMLTKGTTKEKNTHMTEEEQTADKSKAATKIKHKQQLHTH